MLVLRSVLGLDIGGANLKAAHTSGAARLQPFDLWKEPERLPDALRSLLAELPSSDLLAVTMTGELCDCFASKREGVHAILNAVESSADSAPIRIWRNDGRFVDLEAARNTPLQVAAANWLALATFACRYAPTGAALLLDIGSTTSDIVPLLDGRPVPRGRTDPERLKCRELVYTGVRRTPVCALLQSDGAAEFFATMLDVYLILEKLPEDPADCRTADGRPATRADAHARLARMLCADLATSSLEERLELARTVLWRQLQLLRTAATEVAATLPQLPQTAILAGSGEFLGRQLMKLASTDSIVSLAEKLGAATSQAACAHAVATLALEEGNAVPCPSS